MAFQYEYKTFLCRCNRPTKLYQTPTDITPTIGQVLKAGDVFLSERTVVAGRVVLMEITSDAGKDSVLPYGMWCPRDVLDLMYVEDEREKLTESPTEDDSVSISDYVYVKSSNIAVYKTKDSTTPVKVEFKLGETIPVDRKITINNNGNIEYRYRIKSDGTDNPNAGYWIASSAGVQLTSTIVHHASPLKAKSRTVQTQTTSVQTTNVQPRDTGDTGESAGTNISDGGFEVNIENGDSMRLDTLEDELENLYKDFAADYGEIETGTQGNPIGRMTFVHGMPFQYCYITDRRRNATSLYGYVNENYKNEPGCDLYGHAFARNIAANMPIMVLVPGIPKYLTKAQQSFGSSSTNSVHDAFQPFWNAFDDLSEDTLIGQIEGLSGDFDYFSFQIDMEGYHEYVNALCQTAASLMGLKGDAIKMRSPKGEEAPCNRYDWKDYNTSAVHDYDMFSEVLGLDGGVSFAYDPVSSVSDTISNTTGESQFASKLNSMSSQARELQFVLGQAFGDKGASLFGITDGQADFSQWTGIGALLGRAKDFLMNTAEGFNIRFPEIWNDSSYTRSYDVDMHFITPYATAFCKWRYVLVPFFHLFAMAAPQAPTTATVYGRPFIIKAFSKGYFNVEMGIIESLTWKRFGEGDMISSDGVPTQMDISISFKDLYHVLTASHTQGATAMAAFFNNTGLLDMLGTLSGVDMNRVGLPQRLSLYLSTSTNTLMGLPGNFMQHLQDSVANFIERNWFL